MITTAEFVIICVIIIGSKSAARSSGSSQVVT
jgi:hypothetical protein